MTNPQALLLKLLGDDSHLSEAVPRIGADVWPDLTDLARRQHVAAYLYYRLREAGALSALPSETLRALQDDFKRGTFRNMALLAESKRLCHVLDEKKIPVIGLKGLQLLLEEIYPHIALRFLRDIDLLVPVEQLETAYVSAAALGYVPEKSVTEVDFTMKYYYHLPQLLHPEKRIVLELHGGVEREGRVDPSELWANAKAAEHPVSFLDTEDLLIHLCLHISYSDLFRIDLRHYLDIYMLLKKRAEQIDWNSFLIRTEKRALTAGVLLVLQITSELFRCRLPESLRSAMPYSGTGVQLAEDAMGLMWQYDRSSQAYTEYKSRLYLSDAPVYKRVFESIFVSRERLCYLYALRPGSIRIYPYYFIRVYDLFKRHFVKVVKGPTGQKQVESVAKTKRLHAYMVNAD